MRFIAQKMMKINLIKNRAITPEELNRFNLYFLVIIGALSFLTFAIIFISFLFSSQIKKVQKEYEANKEKIELYENKYREEKKVIEELFKDIDLIKQASQKNILSYKLKVISDCLPEGMFIENFNFDEGEVSLNIYVLREQVEKVKQFNSELQKRNFKEINITSGQTAKLGDKEFFSFKITFKLE